MEQDPILNTNTASDNKGFDYERFAAEEAEHEVSLKAGTEVLENSVKPDGGTARSKDSNVLGKEPGSDLYDWVQCLVAALLFCVLLFAFFVRIIGIVGSSMIPTFIDGDSVVISKLFYKPQQGDIVVLRKDSFQEEPIIKRIIATEGQTVDINFEEGIVYVDGEALDEPYTAEPTYNQIDFDGMITVPENCVFVMGDNRNGSLDSRLDVIGCVDERYIMGRVLLRILPFDKFGTVN